MEQTVQTEKSIEKSGRKEQLLVEIELKSKLNSI
jgi:hypothetical protein